jgi:pimeloyl-ACP methyl ester carboxylesterase
MGGMVSSVYAATYPGRARALIVVDSNLVLSPERIASFVDLFSPRTVAAAVIEFYEEMLGRR